MYNTKDTLIFNAPQSAPEQNPPDGRVGLFAGENNALSIVDSDGNVSPVVAGIGTITVGNEGAMFSSLVDAVQSDLTGITMIDVIAPTTETGSVTPPGALVEINNGANTLTINIRPNVIIDLLHDALVVNSGVVRIVGGGEIRSTGASGVVICQSGTLYARGVRFDGTGSGGVALASIDGSSIMQIYDCELIALDGGVGWILNTAAPGAGTIIYNCYIEGGSATILPLYGAYSGAPVYQCILNGSNASFTPDAGTAVGSNIQPT